MIRAALATLFTAALVSAVIGTLITRRMPRPDE
jgi:hypothetical protein